MGVFYVDVEQLASKAIKDGRYTREEIVEGIIIALANMGVNVKLDNNNG